jgi:predicted metalloprotease with PDZ domain
MKTHVALVLLVVALVVAGMSCSRAQPAPEPPRKPMAADQNKQKGWLGVSVGDVDAEATKHSKLKTSSGALVREVVEDSPAAAGGIEDDDVIIEFNGKAIADADDLVTAVRKAKPGGTVPVVVARLDQKKSLQVRIGTLPATEPRVAVTLPRVPRIPQFHMRLSHGSEMCGLQMMNLNSQLGEYFGAPYGKGVLVERVNGKSAAARAGFKAGDVIVKLGKEEIGQTDDLWSAMEDYSEGDTATFQILRKGGNLQLAMSVPEEEGNHFKFFRRESRDAPEEDSDNFWFDNRQFQEEMKHLQQGLRGMGQEIRTKMQGLREKLARELRQVGS